MAVPEKRKPAAREPDDDPKKLVRCNIEVDLIEAEVKALKESLISKEVFDNLMSLKSKVPVAERYTTLLRHVHETMQERLNILDVRATATQAVHEGLIEKNIPVNIASLNKKVPASLKARYLLLFLQPALQDKLELFKSHINNIHSVFTSYQGIWQNLEEHLKAGLICESVLTPLFSKQKDNKEICPYNIVNEEFKKEKNVLNYSLKTVGEIALPCMSASQSEAITTLSIEHLSKLIELLAGYSYNWKNIAAALNFQPQDLQTIASIPSLYTNAPKSYLTRLLQDWLQMTLRHTLPPTVDNFKKALNSQTVGLGALGSELEAIVNKNTHSFSEYNQLYSFIKVLFDAKKPSFTPLYNEIYIEEGESTLIEIQVTTESKEDEIYYRWSRNSDPQPILYLCNADIAWDGDTVSCEVKARSAKAISSVTVPITVHVSCPLDEFTPSLSSMYLSRPEVPEDSWPPTGSTKYINLAIIKQQKVNYGSEYVRFTIRGDVLQDKETIAYSELYESLKREPNQVIFIEGRPGSGKTTFVHKITRDWSGGIRILLLVSLRVLNSLQNPKLSDILDLFSDLKVTPEIIEKRDGKGVCFIFDGLDELSPSNGNKSIVYKIINRSYLHRSTVVVASRPAALAHLRNKADKIIEVIGFLGNHIREYFDHYPFSDASQPVKIKSYLSLHPNLLYMCYLPIHATMVAFLFEVTGQVPKTETKMYELFTHLTLMRSILKNKELESNAGDDILQRLNEEESRYFKQICQLALDKTLSNKQVLHHNEISSYFQAAKKSDISLGLITIDRTAGLYGFKDIYTFLHLTFQEYLTAYHISTLSDEEQMKLIEEHGHKNHMLVVWKFFCGLVNIKPFDNKFKSILHKTQGNILYHFQCAYESQQKIVCTQLLKSIHYDIQLANKYMSTPDFTAIGYVTNKTILPTKLSLANCDVDIVAIDALLSEMEDVSKQSLEGLHIEAKHLTPELVIKFLANFQTLKSFILVNQDFSFSTQQNSTRCEDFSVLKKLQTLTLKGFQEQSGVLQMMISALRQCENLTKLSITDNEIGESSFNILSRSLPHCRSLQRINISKNGMSSDQVLNVLCSMKNLNINYVKADEITSQRKDDQVGNDLLLKHLKQFTNLQPLDIVLEDTHIDIFLENCEEWKDLKELRIESQPQYSLQTTMAVSRALQLYFYNIEILDLKKSICNCEGAKLITAGLRNCPSLKLLDLSSNLLTQEHLNCLLSVNFSKLEKLYLDNNEIGDGGAMLLSSHLQGFPSLQILSLMRNYFSKSGAKALAAELHYCTKLVELDLQGNWIGNDTAHAIADGLKLCTNFKLLSLPLKHCELFAERFKQEDQKNRKKIFGCETIEFA